MAKEILAGLAGAEVCEMSTSIRILQELMSRRHLQADKLFETKGLDFLSRERAQHEARSKSITLFCCKVLC
jgi:hypothetical protein